MSRLWLWLFGSPPAAIAPHDPDDAFYARWLEMCEREEEEARLALDAEKPRS